MLFTLAVVAGEVEGVLIALYSSVGAPIDLEVFAKEPGSGAGDLIGIDEGAGCIVEPDEECIVLHYRVCYLLRTDLFC
ncbi:MAG: hypothetical protein H7Z74_02670 [Anaerolineae bacterium]|nr:hypothetical protein [Gemmatimonadaceae bacterium]